MPRPPDALFTEIQGKKVGLVLGGGGFKGAYQIGVWRALRRLGITTFHSISGTSVGALNALLIGLEEAEAAETLWRKVPFTKWAPRQIHQLAIGFGCLLGPALISLACEVGIVIAVLSLYAPAWHSVLKNLVFLSVGDSSSILYWLELTRGSTAWASTLVGMFLGFFGEELHVFITNTKTHWWPALLMIPLFFAMGGRDAEITVIALGTILGGTLLVIGILSLKRFHAGGRLLSNDDVIRTLQCTVNVAKLRANVNSVFVTTAIRSEFRYPLKVNRLFTQGDFVTQTLPLTEARWLPDYQDLCRAPNDGEAMRLLQQTSALPYAFAGSRLGSGEWISDGGLADNVPLLPVLMSDVDYVIIVALNPSEANLYRSPERLRAHVQRLSRDRWAARLTLGEANRYYSEYMRRYNDSPDNVPVMDLLPPERHTREIGVIVLSPSRALARIDLPYLRFITGTIDSAIPSRRKWFAAGFRDTLRSLRTPDDSVPNYVQFTLLADESLI